MKNKWFSYIKIDPVDRFIRTSGITFEEFYNGIGDKPENLLLIQGFPRDACFCRGLSLEYIPQETTPEFSRSNLYNYGNFCWLDFHSAEQLDQVSNEELAEFLYFAHRVQPLREVHFKSLGNKYAYYAHDDDWSVKVYMKNPEQYRQVIEYKILRELQGRKKTISPIPQEIMDEIFALCLDGAVLDFEHSYVTGVRIYPVGEQLNMDSIHGKLDRMRMRFHGPCLDYSTDTKKWRIYHSK